ncbi:type I-E CRISPR-associated protein Cse2/CasB [Streptomyces sp. BE308]|uniref:type I-E CRISPR-associated protein Cse2/CasB n=1 Tax=Streptomyces sp. BE308 TaxID=3002529 RepID=UPI002E760700|nr:type I-E CRISPR-associated protein Cse2/CasB [Streptomyces sp. BE308]MEE1790585.1 type I-E CRISPR-associated protein Cse2/CasB [Streptomyces sp. BE308]
MTGKIPQQGTGARSSRSQLFTVRVEQLCREDAGARSALRSGLRKDLDSVPRMHRLVAPWLPPQCPPDVERAYYSVAAMIAAQPRSALSAPDGTDAGAEEQRPPGSPQRRYGTSLGTAFATAVTEGPGREKEMRAGTAENRLNLLTRQSLAGLHRHLPASVGYLRSLDVSVDWAQLLDDLSHWRTYSRRISRRWLQDFYRLRDKEAAQQAAADDEQGLTADAPQVPDPA